jgi:hypothetical protein
VCAFVVFVVKICYHIVPASAKKINQFGFCSYVFVYGHIASHQLKSKIHIFANILLPPGIEFLIETVRPIVSVIVNLAMIFIQLSWNDLQNVIGNFW